MSMKLSSAVAKNQVTVKNTISGEVSVTIKGQTLTVPPGGQVNLTSKVGSVTMQDCQHLKSCLQKGLLRLV